MQSPEIIELIEFLKTKEGVKILAEILKDNLSIEMSEHSESDYSYHYKVIETSVYFGEEKISSSSVQIDEK